MHKPQSPPVVENDVAPNPKVTVKKNKKTRGRRSLNERLLYDVIHHQDDNLIPNPNPNPNPNANPSPRARFQGVGQPKARAR